MNKPKILNIILTIEILRLISLIIYLFVIYIFFFTQFSNQELDSFRLGFLNAIFDGSDLSSYNLGKVSAPYFISLIVFILTIFFIIKNNKIGIIILLCIDFLGFFSRFSIGIVIPIILIILFLFNKKIKEYFNYIKVMKKEIKGNKNGTQHDI